MDLAAKKLATLNDAELFTESLVLLAGYPDTRAVLMLADAEWKRRGDARFLAAQHAKGEAREAVRATRVIDGRAYLDVGPMDVEQARAILSRSGGGIIDHGPVEQGFSDKP